MPKFLLRGYHFRSTPATAAKARDRRIFFIAQIMFLLSTYEIWKDLVT
jgi:hypothetical protein